VTVLGGRALDDGVESEAMSFADHAYLVIRDRLIMLDIRPNEAIVESELAAQLKLGRTPVREALKRLEVDRLVVSFPRRGTFATGVDVADLRHISQIRVNLEPVAARSAAENASAAARANLIELAERTDALDVDHIDRDELMRWDLRVHRAIYHAAGNPHLEDVLVQRLASRRICSACGANATADTRQACLKCGGPLVMRTDDGAGIVRERLKVYQRQTRPLVEYYAPRPTFRSIDGNQVPDAVTEAIDSAIASAVAAGGARQ